jgi:quinohemoprotein amine dehydrogenase beta subunit
MKTRIWAPALLAGVLAACGTPQRQAVQDHVVAATKPDLVQDYILTATKPDRLLLVDPRTQRVVSEYHIPDTHNFVSNIVLSPDRKIAYVVVNGTQSIAGIDLRTGSQVFRADLSSPAERVNCMFSFDVTPDGKELIVYEYRTRLEIDEYVVEQPRFAIFSTAGGLQAKPLREFAAPRLIQAVIARKSARSFYALWPDAYEFDLDTGRLIDQRGIFHWDRPNHSNADLSVSSTASEPTGIFAAPVRSTLTGPELPPGGVSEASLMTLDPSSGQLEYHDFGAATAPIFSMVLGPGQRWAFGLYTQLTKIDVRNWSVAGRVDLDHTYYSVNISSDGKDVYVGGGMCDIAIYDAESLAKKGDIQLPGCADQALATLRVIRR